MKKFFKGGLLVGIALVLVASLAVACATQTQPQPKPTQAVTWIYVGMDIGYDTVDYMNSEMLANLTRDTNNLVQAERRPGIYDSDNNLFPLAENTIQIELIWPANWGGDITEWEMSTVPFLFDNEQEFYTFLTAGGWEKYTTGVFEKYNLNLIPIFAIPLAPQLPWTNKPLRTIDDWQGMKVGADSLGRQAIEAFGGTGMNIPFGEIYTGLERGLMDGMVSGDLTGMSMGFYENASYLNLWPFTEAFPLMIVMNRDAFEALSPELQTQVMNSLLASRDHVITNLVPVVKEKTYRLIEEAGVTVVQPDAAEIAKARELAAPILDAWLAEAPENLELVKILEQATGRTIL